MFKRSGSPINRERERERERERACLFSLSEKSKGPVAWQPGGLWQERLL